MPTASCYSVVTRQQDATTPRIAALRDWLAEQAGSGPGAEALGDLPAPPPAAPRRLEGHYCRED